MTRLLALVLASALTACAGTSSREVARPGSKATQATKAASVDPDPCGLPSQAPFGARAEIEPLPFQLASLHVRVPLGPMLEPKLEGPDASDLTLRALASSFRETNESKAAEVVTKSHFGRIEMGAVPATFECSGNRDSSVVLLHYTTLVPHAGESAEYVVGDAWFDEGTCKTMLIRRESVHASALAGGLVYAVREAPSEGAPPDRLTLFMPVAVSIATEGFGEGAVVEEFGNVTRVSIPFQRGGGVSVIATFDTAVLDSWLSDGAPVDANAAHAAYGERELTIGIELTQAVGDRDPVGLAYVEKAYRTRTFARTRLFQCVQAPEEAAAR